MEEIETSFAEKISITMQVVDRDRIKQQVSSSLVGKLLTNRYFNKKVFISTMKKLWKVEVQIENIEENLFRFQFRSARDKQGVVDSGPWRFDNALLIFQEPNELENFTSMPPLRFSDFWVQVHDIPFGGMNVTVAEIIGNSLGTCLDVDQAEDGSCWGEYLRIRVRLDVSKPLQRKKKFTLQDAEARFEDFVFKVEFKYERLPDFFCFGCGRIGHIENDCQLPPARDSDGEKIYGNWLKAGVHGPRIRRQRFSPSASVVETGRGGIQEEQDSPMEMCSESRPDEERRIDMSAVTFEDLSLSPVLLKGLYVDMKYEKPSEIQAKSLPMILTPPYKDLIAQAHNGSGKTTCFALGMLSRVDPILKAPQAFCICPTRELAIQNLEVVRKIGKHTGITSECAVPMDTSGINHVSIAKRPPITAQIVVGTPGTIKKWMSLKKLGVSFVKILVFDEADHMLAEDGFKDDSLRILKDIEKANGQSQVILFSATFNDTVKNFITRVVKEDHNQIFVRKEELSLESIKQYKVKCLDELTKVVIVRDRILELTEKLGQTIIFARTRDSATVLHDSLVLFGYEVTTIHGALNQEDRDKIVKEFRDGLTQVLISTDLLARGFDQQQVNVVINYDLPVKYNNSSEPDYEVYLHRTGRAGRFGSKAAVFNLLLTDEDHILMEKIERYFGTKVTAMPSWNGVEDFKMALKAAGLMH